jgi:hypothetical protein
MTMRFPLADYISEEFIETGTYKGESVQTALTVGFKKVQSIEIKLENYTACLDKFKNTPEVTLHFGDSSILLPAILGSIDHQCTFWLDAHGRPDYNKFGHGEKFCPLQEELDAIKEHPIKNHIILIDDVRIIKEDGWDTEGCTEDLLKEKISSINSNYEFSYLHGHCKKDVLAAVAV